jgi:hypothetical protein
METTVNGIKYIAINAPQKDVYPSYRCRVYCDCFGICKGRCPIRKLAKDFKNYVLKLEHKDLIHD